MFREGQHGANVEPMETVIEAHVFASMADLKGFMAHGRRTVRNPQTGEYITVDVRPTIVLDCGHIVFHPHDVAGKCQSPLCGKFHCHQCHAICALCMRVHCIGCLSDAERGLLCCPACVPKIRQDRISGGQLGHILTAERNAALLGGYIDQIR
jgi:hypothetical protein